MHETTKNYKLCQTIVIVFLQNKNLNIGLWLFTTIQKLKSLAKLDDTYVSTSKNLAIKLDLKHFFLRLNGWTSVTTRTFHWSWWTRSTPTRKPSSWSASTPDSGFGSWPSTNPDTRESIENLWCRSQKISGPRRTRRRKSVWMLFFKLIVDVWKWVYIRTSIVWLSINPDLQYRFRGGYHTPKMYKLHTSYKTNVHHCFIASCIPELDTLVLESRCFGDYSQYIELFYFY